MMRSTDIESYTPTPFQQMRMDGAGTPYVTPSGGYALTPTPYAKTGPILKDWAPRVDHETVAILHSGDHAQKARYAMEYVRSRWADLLHVPGFGFMYWDAHTWNRDVHNDLSAAIVSLGDRWQKYADEIRGTSEDTVFTHGPASLLKSEWAMLFAHNFRDVYKIRPLMEMMKSLSNIRGYVAEDFDALPEYLTVENGVLNLMTGELTEPRPHDLMTVKVEVDFDRDAEPGLWAKFLSEIIVDDEGNTDHELLEWLQVYCGYALTGESNDNSFAVLYGTGANGKSVFIEALRAAFGRDIAYSIGMDRLEAASSGQHPTEIASMRGKRLIVAQEGNEDGIINASLMKRLTGGDTLSARFMRQDAFEFTPTFTVFLSTNYRPNTLDLSHGFFRRIKIVPFKAVFDKSKADRKLLEKLTTPQVKEEILAWCVEGAIQYYAQGKQTRDCATIEREVDQYKSSQDRLAEFIGTNVVYEHADKVKANDVWKRYKFWCEDTVHDAPMKRKTFIDKLSSNRDGVFLSFDTSNVQWIHGMRLVSEAKMRALDMAGSGQND